jgi:hypothetical protein
MTIGVGLGAAVLMALMLDVYMPAFAMLWVILAGVGLLGAFIGSLLMWKFFVLPQTQHLRSSAGERSRPDEQPDQP